MSMLSKASSPLAASNRSPLGRPSQVSPSTACLRRRPTTRLHSPASSHSRCLPSRHSNTSIISVPSLCIRFRWHPVACLISRHLHRERRLIPLHPIHSLPQPAAHSSVGIRRSETSRPVTRPVGIHPVGTLLVVIHVEAPPRETSPAGTHVQEPDPRSLQTGTCRLAACRPICSLRCQPSLRSRTVRPTRPALEWGSLHSSRGMPQECRCPI